MSNERALGTHFGYLAYHVDALSRLDNNLESDLANAREEADSQEERIRAERAVLNDYRTDVAARLEKLERQIENCLEDATETTRDRADEIRDSAVSTHLEETDVPDAGFQTANEF